MKWIKEILLVCGIGICLFALMFGMYTAGKKTGYKTGYYDAIEVSKWGEDGIFMLDHTIKLEGSGYSIQGSGVLYKADGLLPNDDSQWQIQGLLDGLQK